jgi:hypothetical protein
VRTETFPSKAGLTVAGTAAWSAVTVSWFGVMLLVMPALVSLVSALVVAGAYVAGWVARGRTDGR